LRRASQLPRDVCDDARRIGIACVLQGLASLDDGFAKAALAIGELPEAVKVAGTLAARAARGESLAHDRLKVAYTTGGRS
jgi:hypothetical protein